MTTLITLIRTITVAAFAATISACATAPTAPPAPKLNDLLTQATQAAATGQKEKAVTLWKQGAAAYPSEKTPWINIAQTRYEAGQYGDAISAAQEVLVRDPNDKLANSIIATSGLRLATRALADLSRQNNLSGSLRSESQDLAKLLRETLGETALFTPPVSRAKIEREDKPKVTNRKEPRGKTSPDDNKAADPFGALK